MTYIGKDEQIMLKADDGRSILSQLPNIYFLTWWKDPFDMPLELLTNIHVRYDSIQHPFMGKYVQIILQRLDAALQLFKGKEGNAQSHNPLQNTFVIDLFPLGDWTIHMTDVWYK